MNAPHAQPMYFGPEERPLFGWLHRAAEPSSLGVVICNPFGYEAICAHRSLRHAAQHVAEAGLASLRFDYDGTGDSAGSNQEPARVDAWRASIHHAVDALKKHAGVTRVCLLGLRLGATLAASVAGERDDIAALVALAPVPKGRAYVRELRILQGALELRPPPDGVATAAGVHEALGFSLSDEDRDVLSALDLTKLERAPCAKVLVLDRDDLPGADRWVARLRKQGAEVTLEQLPGYVEMVLDPHNAVVPDAMLSRATSWLNEVMAAERDIALTAGEPIASDCRLAGGVQERALFVPGDARLFGVSSEPAEAPASGRAILLLNAGSIHRVGPNRLYTVFARRWAARGDMVFRWDLSGIGDSPARAGELENVVYGDHALQDIAQVVGWIRQQPSVKTVCGIGLCSGAYHLFKAAVAGQSLDAMVATNPLTYFWSEDQDLDFKAHAVVRSTERYGRSLGEIDKWKKLLRGDVDLRIVAKIFWRRGSNLAVNIARDLSRRAGRPWAEDLGAELETIMAHGILLDFVFATGDPGHRILMEQGGSVARRLTANGDIRVQVVENADHTFTQLWSHELWAEALDKALSR